MAMAFWSPLRSQSAKPAEENKMMDAKMMERCEEMKRQKQKMKEEMKAQDADLTAHIAKMNSAPENQKVSVMAAVITHMAEQRIAMNAKMEKMHEEMMKHMMQHMKLGHQSMSQCPMMKDMDEKSEEPHKHK